MGATMPAMTLCEDRPIGGATHAVASHGVLTAGVGFDGRIKFAADNKRDRIEHFGSRVAIDRELGDQRQASIVGSREADSTSQDAKFRATEAARIKCGKKRFAAIGVDDFVKSSPEGWNP